MCYMEHSFSYPNHSFKACGGPEAFTSTVIEKKCWRNKFQRAATLHLENLLGVTSPTILIGYCYQADIFQTLISHLELGNKFIENHWCSEEGLKP